MVWIQQARRLEDPGVWQRVTMFGILFLRTWTILIWVLKPDFETMTSSWAPAGNFLLKLLMASVFFLAFLTVDDLAQLALALLALGVDAARHDLGVLGQVLRGEGEERGRLLRELRRVAVAHRDGRDLAAASWSCRRPSCRRRWCRRRSCRRRWCRHRRRCRAVPAARSCTRLSPPSALLVSVSAPQSTLSKPPSRDSMLSLPRRRRACPRRRGRRSCRRRRRRRCVFARRCR